MFAAMRIRIILLLIFAGSISHFHAISQSKWRFAVVGDTHVGSSDTLTTMIPYMIADNIESLFVLGDIVEGGKACSGPQLTAQLTEWKNIMAPLYAKGIDVYPIRGNHEADAHDNLTAWNSIFSSAYALPQNGPDGEKNLTYSVTHKNALFLCLDNYVNIHKVNQEWLDQQLASNTAPNLFVFGHEAAFKVFHADCLDDSITARNTFWQSLTSANAKVYFCGHDHFLDVAQVEDNDGNANNNIFQYLVGSGGGWLMDKYSNYNGENAPYTPTRIYHDMQHGYALVEISGEGPTDCNVTITWKRLTWNSSLKTYEYQATSNVIQYSSCAVTGIFNNNEASSKISVYPNPASDYINVSGFSGSTTIYDSMGRAMWIGEITNPTEICLKEFCPGMYIIRDKSYSARFLVNK